ncbi:MAG: P-type conjugative transfer ATPase TrbB [Gammaproteobacteria bacterium RIFCSPHIGHO2_02_FULL_42_13]|nr:MAG: P-type conjugative transfer ATPase TrbB [Gammaproteobacteria bacterium RIFCSPHIGHO2_02_FULL_42_13]OGT70043.1 MAG: P-type conjugative transfer ATPase TrbB [Gammaproteobacteria bacterium RIFCSPLOWO2_02_FULL_42_9]
MNSRIKTENRHFDMLMTAFGEQIIGLLEDPDVIEIIVNADGKLWTESLTKGKYFTHIILPAAQTANAIKLVAASQQMVADYEHPEVSCELPKNGARFQGWLPPVVDAPTFTIRKRAIRIFTLEDYIDAGSMSLAQAELLKQAVHMRKNIMIAGGTASGKTTFANALLHELKDSTERMIVLEDLPELQIQVEDHVKLRTTPTKSMRDLVKGILRMRPDRIIIGEVRDGAALELLKAWNTGHPGGICTIHANDAESTLSRLEDLVQEAVSVVPKRLIRQAINIIVFMKRDENGHYQIDSIHRYEKQSDGQYRLIPAM